MNTHTYNFSKSVSEALDIEHVELPELSDQAFSKLVFTFPDNFATYGGGASGYKNGHYGCKHTEEAKEKIRQKALGRKAFNKGIPNPNASEYMKHNNPMFNPNIVKKAIETRNKNNSWVAHDGCFKVGQKPHNYINESRTFVCETCDTLNTVRNIDKGPRRFCNRSCQAKFSNKNRRGFRLRNQISQPEAPEHASS